MNANLRKLPVPATFTGRPTPSSEETATAARALAVRLRALATGLATGLALLCAGAAIASPAGQVTHLSGILSAKKDDGTSKLLSVKSEVQEGDLLTTETDTYARIKFVDGAEVVLRPGTQLKINTYNFVETQPKSDNVFLSMLKGGLRAVTGLIGKRNHDAVSYATATATIGIRGTHFGALLCNNDCANIPTISGGPPANGLHTDTADGTIVISNAAGSVVVPAGSFSFTPSPTVVPKLVPPSQGIQVTMPPSISQNNASGQGVGKNKASECVAQ
jgi:hypothetical protein